MPATSDFAKTSCFTYLTSPILAASRGGQGYEVPLHRLSAKHHNVSANVSQILGIKHRTKTYTQVPDIATQWYACHLKQLQNAMQRECTKEAAAREKACANFFKAQNIMDPQQVLLAQHNALPVCGHESKSELNERTRGGFERKQRNNVDMQWSVIKNNTKYISPEFEELWLEHLQKKRHKNFNFGASPPISIECPDKPNMSAKDAKSGKHNEKYRKSFKGIAEQKKRIIIKKCQKENTRNLSKVAAKRKKSPNKEVKTIKYAEIGNNSKSVVEDDIESIKTIVPHS